MDAPSTSSCIIGPSTRLADTGANSPTFADEASAVRGDGASPVRSTIDAPHPLPSPMARTPSTMVPLGTVMPPFSLPEPATGRVVRSSEFAEAPAVLVAFICNHCPFVKHIRAALAELGALCAERGVAMVAINSNDVEHYPDDAPPRMVEEARDAGWTFPYLFDETQEVARSFAAACTPDFFLYGPLEDASGGGSGGGSGAALRRLFYRGQLDETRPGGASAHGGDLRGAIESLLAGAPPPDPQHASIGCNIKWKA